MMAHMVKNIHSGSPIGASPVWHLTYYDLGRRTRVCPGCQDRLAHPMNQRKQKVAARVEGGDLGNLRRSRRLDRASEIGVTFHSFTSTSYKNPFKSRGLLKWAS